MLVIQKNGLMADIVYPEIGGISMIRTFLTTICGTLILIAATIPLVILIMERVLI